MTSRAATTSPKVIILVPLVPGACLAPPKKSKTKQAEEASKLDAMDENLDVRAAGQERALVLLRPHLLPYHRS